MQWFERNWMFAGATSAVLLLALAPVMGASWPVALLASACGEEHSSAPEPAPERDPEDVARRDVHEASLAQVVARFSV